MVMCHGRQPASAPCGVPPLSPLPYKSCGARTDIQASIPAARAGFVCAAKMHKCHAKAQGVPLL
eukprot:scaffold263106_cov19-Tisochrysis_lutea.AAC.1